MTMIRRAFESFLWNFRYITLLAVIASLIGALAMFYVAGLDVLTGFHKLALYADKTLPEDVHAKLRGSIIASVAQFVDAFLFALVLLIFALGIYELFIGKIEAAENSPIGERIMLVHTLDDLKDRLAKVIFLILIVRYFESALDTPVVTPRDLLSLAAGVLLIAISLYLTKPSLKPKPPP
jgi:uncharacterized membrane protein YqhA